MEHNPYATLNDGTVVTYSDIKEDNQGRYTLVYTETVYGNEWCDMTVRYPGGIILSKNGYNDSQYNYIKHFLDKLGNIAYQFALEEKEINF